MEKIEIKKHLQKVLVDNGLHIAIEHILKIENYLDVILNCIDGTLGLYQRLYNTLILSSS